MTHVLILGGTGWLSGWIAERWRDTGATVTCLARGGRAAPDGVELVRRDRDDPDAYADVAVRAWDHVVDITSRADHAEAAVAALGDHAARWSYISSMSVYSDEETVGADESAPRHPPAQPGDDYEYGAQKVAAEDAVAALHDRALIIRPGLIVGDGDPSDRFGYWAAAFLRAGAESVLLPPLEGRMAQVIDVEDLATFCVTAARSGMHGPVNAIGDAHPLDAVLEAVRSASGHAGDTVVAQEEWLLAQGVAHWAGERSLPLWLPPDMLAFMTRANTAFRAGGGTLRPLSETIARVMVDEESRGILRARRAGLTRSEECALLAELDR